MFAGGTASKKSKDLQEGDPIAPTKQPQLPISLKKSTGKNTLEPVSHLDKPRACKKL